MKPTKELARQIAKRRNLSNNNELLRDQIDTITHGELDCFQLDLLTEWVEEART